MIFKGLSSAKERPDESRSAYHPASSLSPYVELGNDRLQTLCLLITALITNLRIK